jgi:outer membrane protein TolC
MITFQTWKLGIILGISLFFSLITISAQEHYNLLELIKAADIYLPVLKQKQAQINSAKASLTDVKHSFLPQVRVSEQLNVASDNSLAGSLLPLGVTPATSGGIRANGNMQAASGNVAALYGEYELYNFGLNTAKLKTAEAYMHLQEADAEKEMYLIHLQIARLYLTTLKANYRLASDQQNVNRYDSIFKVIKVLTLNGLKPGADSSLAKAELSKARITYNQSFGLLRQLQTQLSYYTGIDPKHLVIDTIVNRYAERNLLHVSNPADTLNNPLIDYYNKRKSVFLTNEKLIKKFYMPRVLLAGSTWARGSSIQYNDDYKSLSTGLGYQRFNYSVGVAITYNLFNRLYRKDKLLINQFETDAAEFELQQQLLLLKQASLQADNAMLTSGNNLAELPIQLQSATDTYFQKLAQYKAGIISLIDLTNASFVLYRSQTDYIETIGDWYISQLDKSAANGTLTQFIQTIK